MRGHTPGPWQRRSIPGHLFEVTGEAAAVVLRIRGGMMPSLEDARLIAAAPELLALVQRFVRAENLIDEAYYAEIEGCEREARALIAQVEG
jgi:hypothetical protein